MENTKAFLKRKDIILSPKRYLLDVLSQMAQAVFASLLIGLILKTIGEQGSNIIGSNEVFTYLIKIGEIAMGLVGPAIGAAVAWGLNAPPLVLFSSVVVGTLGANVGGEAGALIATIVGAEFGKAVSKETGVDILVTPAVTVVTGSITATLIGPVIKGLMDLIGEIIMRSTELQPFLMGMIISVIVGLVLTSPLSSTALCIMLGLTGLAAGAATVGCCAQMVGFAAISYKECKLGGATALGLGSSMFQVPNIIKNPWILLPPTLAAAILGPLSTTVFQMTNDSAGAGMGTCGFVGQICTLTSMGFSLRVIMSILLLHIILPIGISLSVNSLLIKAERIRPGDYYMNV